MPLLFYEKCNPAFSYITQRIFNRNIDKSELINELYLYLAENNWDKLRQFRFQCKLTTWLLVVATRFFLKKMRHLIDFAQQNTLIEESEISTDRSYENFQKKIDLYTAINKLKSSRDRFVIMALEIKGQTIEDVAKGLNITTANLYNVRKRAKKNLSDILVEYKYEN